MRVSSPDALEVDVQPVIGQVRKAPRWLFAKFSNSLLGDLAQMAVQLRQVVSELLVHGRTRKLLDAAETQRGPNPKMTAAVLDRFA